MRNAPCMCCASRSVGCHSKCDAYGVWKKRNDDTREKTHSSKANDWEIHSFLVGHSNRGQNLARERGRKQ